MGGGHPLHGRRLMIMADMARDLSQAASLSTWEEPWVEKVVMVGAEHQVAAAQRTSPTLSRGFLSTWSSMLVAA